MNNKAKLRITAFLYLLWSQRSNVVNYCSASRFMSPSFMSSLEAYCSFLHNQLLKYHLQLFASCAETCFSYSAGVFCYPFFLAVALFCCPLVPAGLSFLPSPLPCRPLFSAALSFLLALRGTWVH